MEEFPLGNAVSVDPSRGRPLEIQLDDRVLAEVLDGGQAFRWNRRTDGSWQGQWHRHVVCLQPGTNGRLHWRADSDTTEADLLAYLGDDAQAQSLAGDLPGRSDPVLATAMRAFPGLRLLRQPLAETLLAFLCSSTKQIVQIKAMMELLAERFGDRLPGGHRALPTWPRLAAAGEAPLRACKLGYRARYVAATADILATESDWETRLRALPYPEAHTWLCRLPGVGAKVADCVLLFGADKGEAFPVDTWILKVLARAYGLEGWTPKQLATFGRIHFGPQAGLAQQFLFAWARAGYPPS